VVCRPNDLYQALNANVQWLHTSLTRYLILTPVCIVQCRPKTETFVSGLRII